MIRAIAGGSFESEWRDVAPSLERVLARYGVSESLRDDVMQETALRLYRSWDRVDPERPLLPLAVTIAKNVVWDDRHRRSQVEVPGEVPDQPTAHDVEELGLARLELERVRAVMDRLSAPHRLVLLAEVGDAEAPAGGRDATKMLRLRARKKMRALMEAASASVFVARVPKTLWRLGRAARRPAFAGAAPAAIAAACSVVALFGVPPSVVETDAPATARFAPPGAVARVDGAPWSRDRTNPDLRPGRDPARAPGSRSGSSNAGGRGPYWHVGLGDEEGPVEGDARLGIVSDPGEEVTPPSCSTDTSEEHEVGVGCRADLGDRKVRVDATVELRP